MTQPLNITHPLNKTLADPDVHFHLYYLPRMVITVVLQGVGQALTRPPVVLVRSIQPQVTHHPWYLMFSLSIPAYGIPSI